MEKTLIYGTPGSGKTWFAMTYPKKIYLLDVDNKAYSLPKTLTENVIIHSITHKPNTNTLRQTALNIPIIETPKGYLEICDIITDFEKKIPEGVTTLVIDSLSQVSEHLKSLILYQNKLTHMRIQDWGTMLQNLEAFINTIISLPLNVVLIAHDSIEKDDLTGRIEYRPLIEGAMRGKIGKYFNEVYYTSPITEVNKTIYRMMVKNDGRHITRTNYNIEDNYVLAHYDNFIKGGDE